MSRKGTIVAHKFIARDIVIIDVSLCSRTDPFWNIFQQNRVDIWAQGKAQAELGLQEKQIRELGESYGKQRNFVGKIAVVDRHLAGYALGYRTSLEKINLADEIVISPKNQNDFAQAIKKQFGIDGSDMIIINGLGVLPKYRHDPRIVMGLASELLGDLASIAYGSGIPAIMFYTWEENTHPKIYQSFGFIQLDFTDSQQPNVTYWFKNL